MNFRSQIRRTLVQTQSGPFISVCLGFSARKPKFSRAHACGHAFGAVTRVLAGGGISFAILASWTRVGTRLVVWARVCSADLNISLPHASGDAFEQHDVLLQAPHACGDAFA